MPVTNFANPKLMPNGSLDVSGPFKDSLPQDLIGDVTIRFLIVQQPEKRDAKPVIVDHVARWIPPGAEPQFKATVPANEVKKAEAEA